MSGWVACLDASVLIPQPTVDTLLRFAQADVRWAAADPA